MRCPVCEANKDGKCMAGVIPCKSKKSVDGIGCNLNRRTVKKRMRGENMGGIYIPNMTEEMAKEHLRGFIYIPVPPPVFGMTVKADYALPDDYDFLVQYEPPRPKTNADIIRGMSDEKLAEWITELTDCTVYPHTRKDAPCVSIGQTCAASWLDWLKQEAN